MKVNQMTKENKPLIYINRDVYVRKLLQNLEVSLDKEGTETLPFGQFFSDEEVLKNIYTLYRYITLRSKLVKSGEEINPELNEIIKTLLSNKQVYDGFIRIVSKGKTEGKKIQKNELFTLVKKLQKQIDESEEKISQLRRELSQKISITDQEILSFEISKLIRIIKNCKNKINELELNDFNPRSFNYYEKENYNSACEISAKLQYETLLKYRDELKKGFVWTASRKEILNRVVETISNTSRSPVLIGESGTGKSSLANAAALVLTGELPVTINCDQDLNPDRLTRGTEDFTTIDGNEITYTNYGPITRALTRFKTSLDKKPEGENSLIIRFEEAFRAGPSIYAMFKSIFSQKPGSLFQGKEVLPGGGIIFTTNPAGSRYDDRQRFDAALLREVFTIEVDYLPMSQENPELYEFMLACLMDDNGLIKATKEEVSPYYKKHNVPNDSVTNNNAGEYFEFYELEDPRAGGYLYRMSFAFREIQNAFNDYNSGLQTCSFGFKIKEAVVTPEIIRSILKSHVEGSFTKSMISELKKFVSEVKNDQDKQIIKKIFDEYGLLVEGPFNTSTPLTPRDIGFLSPRVRRPVETIDYGYTYTSSRFFEEAGEVKFYPKKLETDDWIIDPGAYLIYKNSEDKYEVIQYLGVDENNKDNILFVRLEYGESYKSPYTFTIDDLKLMSKEIKISKTFNELFDLDFIFYEYFHQLRSFVFNFSHEHPEVNNPESFFISFTELINLIERNLTVEVKEIAKKGLNRLLITTSGSFPDFEFNVLLITNPTLLKEGVYPNITFTNDTSEDDFVTESDKAFDRYFSTRFPVQRASYDECERFLKDHYSELYYEYEIYGEFKFISNIYFLTKSPYNDDIYLINYLGGGITFSDLSKEENNKIYIIHRLNLTELDKNKS